MNFSIKNLISKKTNKLKPLSNYLNANEVLLNSIVLELVSEFNQEISTEIPATKLDNGANKSDNIANNPDSFSIKVQLTGTEKDRIYEEILTLAKKREPVRLFTTKLYENLGIASVSQTMNSYEYIELQIEFVQMEFAYIDRIPAPAPRAKPLVSKKTEVRTSKREWEGGLASESIKLKGE